MSDPISIESLAANLGGSHPGGADDIHDSLAHRVGDARLALSRGENGMLGLKVEEIVEKLVAWHEQAGYTDVGPTRALGFAITLIAS